MIKVDRLVNSIFNSNSYLLSRPDRDYAWIIDPGDSAPLINKLGTHNLKGILLTHSHFDHIYGLNDLIKIFPDVSIYTNECGRRGLECDKLNGSRYTDFPFIVKHENLATVGDGDKIDLWEDMTMQVWDTPGHNLDCLTFYTKGSVFTGDALIPGIKVVAKGKFSDKQQVLISIDKILQRTLPSDILYPGHNQCCPIKDCEIADL